jgi:hypothetical protein
MVSWQAPTHSHDAKKMMKHDRILTAIGSGTGGIVDYKATAKIIGQNLTQFNFMKTTGK